MGLDLSSVKRALRKSIIAGRDAISTSERSVLSETISRKIVRLEAYEKADLVLAYMSFGSEFETDGFVRGVLEAGKALALPRLKPDKGGLDLHLVTDIDDGLESGIWGIREPRGGDRIEDFSRVGFILVPGVAFTTDGGRLGYGGGFYDRLLAEKGADAVAVAAAFAMQMVEELPLEDNDIAVDGIVTEAAEYFRKRECP